jgi:hypothetical protein
MPKRTLSFSWPNSALLVWVILCAGGLVLVIVGGVGDRPLLLRIGSSAFLGGIAVWALTNGVQFLRGFVIARRRYGWKALIQRPWGEGLYLLLIIFFFWLAVRLILFIWGSFHRTTSNQAMQRTASKAATGVVHVCHQRFGSVACCRGLAVADLVSR